MNKKLGLVIGLSLAVVAISAFFIFEGKSLNQKPKANDAGATEEGVANIVEANNKQALDFYANLRNGRDNENIFFSPYSISTAMTMVYEGAASETAEEIQQVFYILDDDQMRRSAAAAVYNSLNKANSGYQLQTANSLWVENDYELQDDFTKTVEGYYGGLVTNVDFSNNSDEARQTINNWVEDETNDKIKDLFSGGSINGSTRLVLTNAIYFKGDWLNQFDKDETKDEDFRINENKTVTVPMMRNTVADSNFNYAETDDIQALEIFYEGEELSMILLLPKDKDIESLEESLSIENLNIWKEQLQPRQVNVFMPKFTFESKYNLNANLASLGINLAFDPPKKLDAEGTLYSGADFSRINEERELFISLVIHQAFIDVGEEGTEAAAATGVVMAGPISIEPPVTIPVFRADHPFIFLIQDTDTGNILFMGKVLDPTA